MKIHAGLKWNTIIRRLNKQYGYERYKHDDQYENIYELDKKDDCYLFLLKDYNKQYFIDFLSLGLNTMTEDEAEDELEWCWDDEMETGYYA